MKTTVRWSAVVTTLCAVALGACASSLDDEEGKGADRRWSASFDGDAAGILAYQGRAELAFSAPTDGSPAGERPPSFAVRSGYTRISPTPQVSARDFTLVLAEGADDASSRLTVSFTVDLEEAQWSAFLDGDELDVACDLSWSADGRAWTLGYEPTSCRARRDGGGYALTIAEAVLYDDQDGALIVTGTVELGPAPTELTVFWSDGMCDDASVCLVPGIAPWVDDEQGYCLPADNLAESAVSCDAGSCEASGGVPVRFGGDGGERCLCLEVCGRVSSGGSSLPTCDPSYGCIPF